MARPTQAQAQQQPQTPEEIGVLEFNNKTVEKVIESETFGKISLVITDVDFPSYKQGKRIDHSNIIRLNPYTLLEQTRKYCPYLRAAGRYAGEKANKLDIWLWIGALEYGTISFKRVYHEADEERPDVLDENGNPTTYGSPTWTTEITSFTPHYDDEATLKNDVEEFKADMKAERKARTSRPTQNIIINPGNLG